MPRIELSFVDFVSEGRFRAAQKLPYLAKALWRLTFVECTEVPTFAVDSHWRVYCNPAFTKEAFYDKTLAGDIIHECLHRVLEHEKRAKLTKAEDGDKWNRAGDAEINERIRDARVDVWAKAIYPETEGWEPRHSAEEYYRCDCKDGKGGGRGKCSGGSGVTGKPLPFEKGEPSPEVRGGVTEAEAIVVRAQVAQAIKAHAKARGNVPAELLRWAESFGTPPPVPWHELVSAQVRYQIEAKLGPSPSYARPSRRMWDSIVLPVHRLPVPTVAVVGDTSGSMVEGDIAKIVATVYDGVDTLGRLLAVGCDAAASEVVEVNHIDDLRQALRGGGGTDMRVGLAKAAEAAPDCIVCVTDGETPWPDAPPDGIPVVIVLTRGAPSYRPPPAWATVIDARVEGEAA